MPRFNDAIAFSIKPEIDPKEAEYGENTNKGTLITVSGDTLDEIKAQELMSIILSNPWRQQPYSSRMHRHIEFNGRKYYVKAGMIARTGAQTPQLGTYNSIKGVHLNLRSEQTQLTDDEGNKWEIEMDIPPLQYLIYHKSYDTDLDNEAEIEYTVDLDLSDDFTSIDSTNSQIINAAKEMHLDPTRLISAMNNAKNTFYDYIKNNLDYYPPHDNFLRQFMFRINQKSRCIEMKLIDIEWFDPPIP